jgi:hypothetical protein
VQLYLIFCMYPCCKIFMYQTNVWLCERKALKKFFTAKTEPQIKNFIELKLKEKESSCGILLCKSWTNDFETNWNETKTSSYAQRKTKLTRRKCEQNLPMTKSFMSFFQFLFSISLPFFLLHLSHCSLNDERTSKTF